MFVVINVMIGLVSDDCDERLMDVDVVECRDMMLIYDDEIDEIDEIMKVEQFDVVDAQQVEIIEVIEVMEDDEVVIVMLEVDDDEVDDI